MLNKIKNIIKNIVGNLFFFVFIASKIFTANPMNEKNPKTIELTESHDKINF
jgi:hypothetical protein